MMRNSDQSNSPRTSHLHSTLDVADRLAETAVQESEARLAFALEAGQMGTFDWHISSGRILWSPTVERLHGYDPGALPTVAQSYWSQLHPEDHDRVQDQL